MISASRGWPSLPASKRESGKGMGGWEKPRLGRGQDVQRASLPSVIQLPLHSQSSHSQSSQAWVSAV